jgi:hypothetical protein
VWLYIIWQNLTMVSEVIRGITLEITTSVYLRPFKIMKLWSCELIWIEATTLYSDGRNTLSAQNTAVKIGSCLSAELRNS